MKRFTLLPIVGMLFALLLLTHCGAPPLASADPTATTPSEATPGMTPTTAEAPDATTVPTQAAATATTDSVATAGTPTASPDATTAPTQAAATATTGNAAPLGTPTAEVSPTVDRSDWSEHRLDDLGILLHLPPDWEIAGTEGGYAASPVSAGPPPDPAFQAFTLGFRQIVPATLPGLISPAATALSENEPGPIMHAPVTIGGLEGVAFTGFQYVCWAALLPNEGLVVQLVFLPYMCEGEGGTPPLSPEAEAILDGITFFTPVR